MEEKAAFRPKTSTTIASMMDAITGLVVIVTPADAPILDATTAVLLRPRQRETACP